MINFVTHRVGVLVLGFCHIGDLLKMLLGNDEKDFDDPQSLKFRIESVKDTLILTFKLVQMIL